jgi:hypothetical protein
MKKKNVRERILNTKIICKCNKIHCNECNLLIYMFVKKVLLGRQNSTMKHENTHSDPFKFLINNVTIKGYIYTNQSIYNNIYSLRLCILLYFHGLPMLLLLLLIGSLYLYHLENIKKYTKFKTSIPAIM